MAQKPNILVSTNHGFQVRNFLQTDFIYALASHYNVIVVISKENEEHLGEFVNRLQLPAKVEGISVRTRKFEEKLVFLRKNIFVNPKRARTKNILNELYGRKLGPWRKVVSVLNYIFGTFEFVRATWRGFESIVTPGREFDRLIQKYKPVRIVTANYGTEPFEIRLLRAARRNAVKSIAIVPSWDNLTSKGVMGVKPDALAVWNHIMKEEAIELHSFRKDRIFITGPLQFDNFYNQKFIWKYEKFLSKFGIEKGRRVIVFGTITPKYFRYNLQVLEILKKAILSRAIAGNPKLLVRIHPQVVKDPVYGDNLEQYLSLREGNDIFAFSIPEIEEWKTVQVPNENDYAELISLLTYADICISSASTLIFDAFACNTCFIGIGFDGYEKGVPPSKSVRRMFEFEHYKNVYKIGGFFIAESEKQLLECINTYLRNPAIHAEERALTLAQQIQFTDGKSYRRALDAIVKMK